MIFDVIVSWPENCDFPQWREMIKRERQRFNRVIISVTPAPLGDNYMQFVMNIMSPDYILFIDPYMTGGIDWRHTAVKRALVQSYNADWLWFTEQDFYPKDGFWEHVYKAGEDHDVIGIKQGDRLHPACLFIKRNTLELTSKDFSAKPPEYDHFGQIQKDLELLEIEPAHIPDQYFKHYNGMTHNWRLITENEPPNYCKDEFYDYLRQVLDSGVYIHPTWRKTAKKALRNA
jgi:hypothetical protein